MHATQSLVSVVIPAFNAERWIVETLDSAMQQTWPNLEIIVVDDGSADSTADIVDRCADPRVRLVRQENRGAAAARNRGMRESGGDFIQFLDADDLLAPDKVALQMRALDTASPKCVASGEWGRFSSDAMATVFQAEAVWTVSDPVDWLVMSLSGGGMMQPAAWLTPREVANDAGPWDESLSLHDDGEFFARVLLCSGGNVFVPGARVFYRDVAGSLSRRRSRRAVESAMAVCRSRHHHLLEARDDPFVRRAIATQYAQFAYEFSPVAPDLGREAMRAIASLRARPLARIGGRSFRLLATVIGFESAQRLRGFGLWLHD